MNIDLSSRGHLYEIFEDIQNTKNKEEAVTIMKKYDCPALRDVLKAAFDPSVKWLVDHTVKYAACPEGSVPSSLLRRSNDFKYLVFFYKGPNKQYNDLPQEKRTSIFIGLLESIHQKDAQIVIDAVQKQINYRNVNATNALTAFPGLWK